MIDRKQLLKDIKQKLKQCGLNGIMDISMTPEVGVDAWPQIYVTFPHNMVMQERLSYAMVLSLHFHTVVGYRSNEIELVGIEYTKACHPHLELICYDDKKRGECSQESIILQKIEQTQKLDAAERARIIGPLKEHDGSERTRAARECVCQQKISRDGRGTRGGSEGTSCGPCEQRGNVQHQ